jgi:hypothetical protein
MASVLPVRLALVVNRFDNHATVLSCRNHLNSGKIYVLRIKF